jgi:hypothetical protein
LFHSVASFLSAFLAAVHKFHDSIRIKYFRLSHSCADSFRTDAYFRWHVASTDSSVVPDTLIDLLLIFKHSTVDVLSRPLSFKSSHPFANFPLAHEVVYMWSCCSSTKFSSLHIINTKKRTTDRCSFLVRYINGETMLNASQYYHSSKYNGNKLDADEVMFLLFPAYFFHSCQYQFEVNWNCFCFFIISRRSWTALGPTQPPIQWVPGVLSLGVKRSEREANHSPPSSAEVKDWVELYLHSSNRPPWRGAQLKCSGLSLVGCINMQGTLGY